MFPNAPHGQCLQHLYENMYKEFKHLKLKTFLWQAARATTEEDFNKALAEMEGIDPRALQWLLNHSQPQHWAELYFPGRRYGHITSNIAESLNSSLLEAREKPILEMFEHIRQHLMSWYAERRQIDSVAPPNQIVVSTVAKKIQELTTWQARRYHFLWITDTEFEVLFLKTNASYTVMASGRVRTGIRPGTDRYLSGPGSGRFSNMVRSGRVGPASVKYPRNLGRPPEPVRTSDRPGFY